MRNKTINTPFEDGEKYIARCLALNERVNDIRDIIDRTVIGDSFYVLALLPSESVDLIIVDPPYNLTKIFNGKKFAKKSSENYESYTRSWLSLVSPILKSSGSIYICCDWETSLIIGRVAEEFFKVQNRITWQREKGRG